MNFIQILTVTKVHKVYSMCWTPHNSLFTSQLKFVNLKDEKILSVILSGLFLLLNKHFAFSQENFFFDFTPNTFLIPNSGNIEVTINYKNSEIKKENFRVRPYMKDTVIALYNPDEGKWVFSSESWGNLPSIEEKIKLQIPAKTMKADLVLKIKDLSTGKEYETPPKSFWAEGSYEKYYEKVNETILDWRQGSSGETESINENTEEGIGTGEATGPAVEEQTQKLDKLKNKSDMALVNLGGFFVTAIVGFLRKDDRIPL
jgi:hypothetical protein